MTDRTNEEYEISEIHSNHLLQLEQYIAPDTSIKWLWNCGCGVEEVGLDLDQALDNSNAHCLKVKRERDSLLKNHILQWTDEGYDKAMEDVTQRLQEKGYIVDE